MPPKGKGRGKAVAAGHELATALPKGEELKDLRKHLWFLGPPIGSGGFGLIYLADDDKKRNGNEKAKFVIKVEPHGNGPLYSEVAFYQRVAKKEMLADWKKKSHLSYVGIPSYIAHGLHTYGKESLRFMVMPRFGCDLHNLWIKAKKRFQRATVCQIAVELINSLEYIHDKEYVHADIKGANILLGYEEPNKIFLVDFGLAYRYVVEGQHKVYSEDPRKAHDGTIEYTSRDAHMGVAPSRRADMEILGYVLLHWLAGRLPWEDKLSNKNYVKEQKIKYMKNIKGFIAECLPDAEQQKADEIQKYLEMVSKLGYTEKPDYDKMRKLFKDALKVMKVGPKSKISFEVEDSVSSPVKKSRKMRLKPLSSTSNLPEQYSTQSSSDSEEETQPKKQTQRSRGGGKQRKITKSKDGSSVASSSTSDRSPVRKTAKKKTVESSTKKMKRDQPANNRKNKSRRRTVLDSSEEDKFLSTDENDEVINNLSSSDQSEREMIPPSSRVRKTRTMEKVVSKSDLLSTDENDEVINTLSSSDQRERKMIPPSSRLRKTRTMKKVVSKSGNSSEDINIMDSTCDVELEKSFISEDSDPAVITTKSKSSCSISKSRHSMAPLHTLSVLGKHDRLSGKSSGKHPVIIRRRKVKRPGADATTQTTPNLRKTSSRV